jgi:ABC-type lipoprotein release transport system permease subunit
MLLNMAWRNIWRNKTRSLIIIFSVIIGLAAGLFVLSLYKGMIKARIRTVIEREEGHLQIHHPEFLKDKDPAFVLPRQDQLLKFIASDNRTVNLSKRTVVQGMVSTATGSDGVEILGIDYLDECVVSQLDKKLLEGTKVESLPNNKIIIGSKLAKKLKVKSGNKLVLTFTDTAAGMVSAAFRIVSILESENTVRDERIVYVDRSGLNNLLGLTDEFNEISVILKMDQGLEGFSKKISTAFPEINVQTWMDVSPETKLMSDTVNVLSLIIMVIILMALAFGIVNTMLMAVLERKVEIGLMMALGFDKWRLFLLILVETVLLTLSGIPLALIGSWLLIDRLNRTGMSFYRVSKEMMSSFGFSNIIYPEFPSEKLLMVLSIVIGTALLACIMPALKALGLKPSDALRK